VARRIFKQVNRATNAVRKGVELYNEQAILYGQTCLPLTMNLEQALDPCDDAYSEIIAIVEVSVPASVYFYDLHNVISVQTSVPTNSVSLHTERKILCLLTYLLNTI